MAYPAIRPGDPFCGHGLKKRSLVFVRLVQASDQWSNRTVTHQGDFLFLFLFHSRNPPFSIKIKEGRGNCQ